MHWYRASAFLVLLGILVSSPAAALGVSYLEIVVARSGDATVTFEYTLTWPIRRGLRGLPERELLHPRPQPELG
jgi:hypothetical protein